MKTIVINAGPKRRDVNAKLAHSAAKGAESSGSEVEFVDLYKIDLRGCMSCLICNNNDDECKCYWKDEISPLIERILDADSLIIAAPVFFSEPTSHYRALMERLIFCMVSYKIGNKFKGKVNVGLFYTVNYPLDYFEKSVRPNLKQSEDLLEMFNGDVEIHTYQNISRLTAKDAEMLKEKEEQLQRNLEETFEIGARLSQ
ncbi:flavodoxin family protein [Methanobrevibacter sp.]|uniref:flavodoxin family protein n=1 Tax=Methanobrevibacter sp. TaxID=66852 RepID=UPI00388F6CCA